MKYIPAPSLSNHRRLHCKAEPYTMPTVIRRRFQLRSPLKKNSFVVTGEEVISSIIGDRQLAACNMSLHWKAAELRRRRAARHFTSSLVLRYHHLIQQSREASMQRLLEQVQVPSAKIKSIGDNVSFQLCLSMVFNEVQR